MRVLHEGGTLSPAEEDREGGLVEERVRTSLRWRDTGLNTGVPGGKAQALGGHIRNKGQG